MGPGHTISSRETVYGMTRTIPVPRRGIGGESERDRKEGPYVAWEKTWPIALTVSQAVDWKWRDSWPAYEIRFLCGRFGVSGKKKEMVFHDADWRVLSELLGGERIFFFSSCIFFLFLSCDAS